MEQPDEFLLLETEEKIKFGSMLPNGSFDERKSFLEAAKMGDLKGLQNVLDSLQDDSIDHFLMTDESEGKCAIELFVLSDHPKNLPNPTKLGSEIDTFIEYLAGKFETVEIFRLLSEMIAKNQHRNILHIAALYDTRGSAIIFKVLGILSKSEISDLLLSKDTIENSVVHLAAMSGNIACLEATQELFKNDLMDWKRILSATNAEGDSALHLACNSANAWTSLGVETSTKIVEILQSAESVKLLNNKQLTPLMICCLYGLDFLALQLLEPNDKEHAADANQMDPLGRSCLHVACYAGEESCVELLLNLSDLDDLEQTPESQPRVNLNVPDRNGITSIGYCLGTQGNELVRLAIARNLIQCGESCLSVDSKGRTPLHFACNIGHSDCVKYLIYKNADVNAADNRGRTALMTAILGGHDMTRFNVVELLISYNANISAKDKYGRSAIHYVAHKGYHDMLPFFFSDVKSIDHIGLTPLHFGISHHQTIKKLLDAGLAHNVKDKMGRMALHACAAKNAADSIYYLVHHSSCDTSSLLEVKDCNNRTPLHYSCLGNKLKATKTFLIEGSDPNAEDSMKQTPLHLACVNNHARCVEALIETGKVDISIKDIKGRTALHAACYSRSSESLEIIFDSPLFDIQIISWPDHRGRSALHFAALANSDACIRCLVNKKATIDCIDNDGYTPVHLAASKGHVESLQLLLDLKACGDIKSIQGITPLMCASYCLQIKTHELLMAIDENPDAKDKKGRDHLDYYALGDEFIRANGSPWVKYVPILTGNIERATNKMSVVEAANEPKPLPQDNAAIPDVPLQTLSPSEEPANPQPEQHPPVPTGNLPAEQADTNFAQCPDPSEIPVSEHSPTYSTSSAYADSSDEVISSKSANGDIISEPVPSPNETLPTESSISHPTVDNLAFQSDSDRSKGRKRNNSTSSSSSETHTNAQKYDHGETIIDVDEMLSEKDPILHKDREEEESQGGCWGVTGCFKSSWLWWKSLSTLSAIKFVFFLLFLLAFIVLVILSVIPNSPIIDGLQSLVTWIENIPKYYSYPIMITLYIVLIPLGCPITPINLVSGYLFGVWAGTGISTLGTMIGATVCFILALTLAKEWADRMLASRRIFKAIHLIVRNEAWKLIILAHLSPILPSAILNYIFASMGVHIFTFEWATLLGVFPLIFAYCYIGSLASNIIDAFNGNGESNEWWKLAIYIAVAIITTAVLVGFFAWITKRELKKAMALLESEEAKPLLDSSTSSQEEGNGFTESESVSRLREIYEEDLAETKN